MFFKDYYRKNPGLGLATVNQYPPLAMLDLRGAMNKRRLVNFASFMAACVVAVMALGASGCSRDPEQVAVDFSKTLPGAPFDSIILFTHHY